MEQNELLGFEEGKRKVIVCWLDVQLYFIASSKAYTSLTVPPNDTVTLIHTQFLLPAVSLSFMSGPDALTSWPAYSIQS